MGGELIKSATSFLDGYRKRDRRRRRPPREEFSFPVPVTVYLDKGPGSLWIEGIEAHWIDSDGNEWYASGTFVSTPSPAEKGSIWIDTDFNFHFIDESGDERMIVGIEVPW